MKPAFILLSAVIAASPFVAHADSDNSVVTREYQVAAHGALTIDVNRANIVIEPSATQSVRVVAREHCAEPGTLIAPTLHVSVAHSATRVEISAEDNSLCSSNHRAELLVQIPHGFSVRVRDGEGNIRVGNVGGVVDATTHYGVVRIHRTAHLADVAPGTSTVGNS